MHGPVVDVPLAQVRLDLAYYPREQIDESRVQEFRELLRDPESAAMLPPVELIPDPTEPGILLVGEGAHRSIAYLDEGRLTIPAVILPPDTDIFLHAVQQAATTPKPLTRVEKRSAVTRLLTDHPDWSNHRIADVARGLLIYPAHEVPVKDEVHIRNVPVSIRQTTIDLGGQGQVLLRACDQLAGEVFGWIEQ